MVVRKIDFVKKYDKKSGRWVKQLISGGPQIVPKLFEKAKSPKLLVEGVTGAGHPSRKKIETAVRSETTKRLDDVGDTILSQLRKRTGAGATGGAGGSDISNIRKRIEGLITGSGLQVM